MAYSNEGIALGIGAQTNQTTANTNVMLANNLIPGVASVSGATGILLHSPEDLQQSYERIESDGGVLPGFLSRVSGTFQRISPVVSFTIDSMGNRNTLTTPVSGEYNAAEYMKQILGGARMSKQTPTASQTEYGFENIVASLYKTLKIWRGDSTHAESWVLVGCTFNLTWNLVAGEKATITVDVFADSVIYDQTDPFPTNTGATAYGNQIGAAPILRLAAAKLHTITRGFQSGTIAISYDVQDFEDCNAVGGISKSQSGRTVEANLDWIVDTAASDYTQLTVDATTGTFGEIDFKIGQVSGAGQVQNATELYMQNMRYTTETKVDSSGKVVRNITGYGVGTAGDDEFNLVFV